LGKAAREDRPSTREEKIKNSGKEDLKKDQKEIRTGGKEDSLGDVPPESVRPQNLEKGLRPGKGWGEGGRRG